MIKADESPWRKAIPLIICAGLVMGAWAVGGFRQIPFIVLGVCLYLILLSLWDIRGYRQAETRRHAAIEAPISPVPLAAPQPAPDATAMVLPFTLQVSPRWLAYGCILLPIMTLAASFFFVLIWPDGPAVRVLVSSLLLGILLTGLWARSGYQRIIVNEEELLLITPSRRQAIRWEDARLFAIAAGTKPTTSPSRYELSSATAIVRWNQAKRLLFYVKLQGPFEEYQQQMAALLSLIAARTGLPLYDLRQPLPHVTSASPSTTAQLQ